MAYATVDDYVNYKGLVWPANDWDEAEIARINAGLLSAQDDVDSVILLSSYDPTAEATITALTRATCARFDFMEEVGDDGTGVMSGYDSVAIGSVRLAKNTGQGTRVTTDPAEDAVGPRAATILRNAGLLTGLVMHR
jgi:ABC-type xylose transport system substrate-binding protein